MTINMLALGTFDADLIQDEATRELGRRLTVDELQCVAIGGAVRVDARLWIPDKGNPWVRQAVVADMLAEYPATPDGLRRAMTAHPELGRLPREIAYEDEK